MAMYTSQQRMEIARYYIDYDWGDLLDHFLVFLNQNQFEQIINEIRKINNA